MKRRDFVAGAAFAAVYSWSVRAVARPCPPANFSARGGTSAATPCVQQSVAVPSWFRSLQPLEWAALASGPGGTTDWQRGGRLAEAVPPPPYFGGYGPRYLTAGWNGACVDTDNAEMIIALNGGHAAWQYNDAYALALGSESPGWRRIVDATPEMDPRDGRRYYDAANNATGASGADGYIDRVLDPSGQNYSRPFVVPGWLNDGPQPAILAGEKKPDLSRVFRRPRTLHTCSHYHYSNGRIWYPIMNAWNQGSGLTSLVKLALDVDAVRRDPSLKAWRYGSPRPWQYLGVISEQTGGDTGEFGFGVGALDPSTGRVWYVGQKTSNYWSLETLGGSAGNHQFFSDAPRGKDLRSSAGNIAHGVRVASGGATSLFVLMEIGTHRLWILDISKAGSGSAWSVVEPVNGSRYEWAYGLKKVSSGYAGHPAGYGMVFHEPSQSFLAYNCDQLPNRSVLRRLAIPLHSDGTYDPKGDWVWSEIACSGQAPATNNPRAGNIGGGGGSYTRFNILPDFCGSGQALLVHLSHFDQPTFVCKLGSIA